MKRIFTALKILAVLFGLLSVYTYVAHIRLNGSVETVAIQSGDIVLNGMLVKPDGPGPYPAVVLLHGAGPGKATDIPPRLQINALRRSGFAVLLYDKRGVGGSGGEWRRNFYPAFIDDGISAVRFLQSRPDIRNEAIGLLGNSEGGWFTPEIAARTGGVAFIINRAGPAVGWVETELWETRNELRDSGLTGAALEDPLEMLETIWRFALDVVADPTLEDGQRWQEINAALAAHESTYAGTGSAISTKRLPPYDEALYSSLAAYMGYDPQPFIEQATIPMLYFYGAEDKNVPPASSLAYLASLQAAGKSNIETVEIPGVEHGMVSMTAIFTAGLSPKFISVIGPWAAAHASVPNQ